MTESEIEVRDLVDRYAVAADDRDHDGFAALFAPDGALVVLRADGTERSRYRGRDELVTVPAKLAAYDRTLHLVSTHLLDTAAMTGVTYCEAHHVSGTADRVLFIRYDDEYVATDGEWRFGTRVVRTLFQEERTVG